MSLIIQKYMRNPKIFSFARLKHKQLFNVSFGLRGITTVQTGKETTISGPTGGFTNESIDPVKIAYTSYEATSPMAVSSDYPVIIMHGLLGSKGNWNSLSKVIHTKTKRKIIAVDARNHGDSAHSPHMTYDHLAEDVRALMQDLQINQASMIGHSMGGRALMRLSLKYPELVEKLIVVDISPIGSSPTFRYMQKYFDAMDAVKLEPNIPQSVARKSANDQLSAAVPDPGVRQFILTNLVEGENGQYKWRIDLFSIATNFNNIAMFPETNGKTFNKPTLFIAGGASDFIKENDYPKILDIFPEAKFETIPDAGHWVHAEKPTEFVETVRKFLANEKKDS